MSTAFSDRNNMPTSPKRSWMKSRIDQLSDWWATHRVAERGPERLRRVSSVDEGSKTALCAIKSVEEIELLQVIGEGGFGRVCLAMRRDDSTETKFAVKISEKRANAAGARRLRRYNFETELLSQIHFPLILETFGHFEDDESLYRIMEFLPGGTLRYIFASQGPASTFPVDVVRNWAAEVTSAICYCHENQILYRDLKPQNLMVDLEGHLRLVDFDLATRDVTSPLRGASTYCGTLEYMAPEVIARRPQYGFAVDWWGVGAVLHEALTGLPPFYMADKEMMARRIVGEQVRLTQATVPDNAARKLVLQLLTRDPEERLGSSQRRAAAILRHEFFKSINWHAVSKKRLEPRYIPPKVETAGLQVDRRVLRMNVPQKSSTKPYINPAETPTDGA